MKASNIALLGHPKANIETDFSYKACCNDESKTLNALNTTKLDAKTCSERQCFYSDELLHSTWISHQVCGIQKRGKHLALYLIHNRCCLDVTVVRLMGSLLRMEPPGSGMAKLMSVVVETLSLKFNLLPSPRLKV